MWNSLAAGLGRRAMDERSDELDVLAPTPLEVAIGLVTLLHLVLVIIVLVQVLRGRLTVPHGLLGVVGLLLLPVVGPVLVLARTRRGSGIR